MQTTEVSATNNAGAVANALERRLDVSLPIAAIEQGVEQRLKKISRNVKLPGFRPGKVPFKIIAQNYGNGARIEIIEEMLNNAFNDKVREQKLRVAGTPRIEPKSADAEGADTKSEMVFSAVFEVFPEVVVGDLASQQVERPQLEVTEADVDRTIEVLRKQRATFVEVDRASEKDDRVTIDFVGRKDGEVFEGGSAQDFPVVVGSGSMLPDFDAALLGVKAGDSKTFEVNFPEDYHAKNLAGAKTQFEINVKKVEGPSLPEINTDFARELGIEGGDVSKMRGEVQNNLEGEVKRRLQARIKENVMQAILAATPVDVPRSLIDLEAQHMVENARQDMLSRGMQNAKDMPIQAAWFEQEAQKRVKLGLILAEIVKVNGLQAKPEQVRAKVEELAKNYEDPSEVIRFYYGQPQRLSQIEALVTEENVVEWTLTQVKVDNKPVSFEELMGQQQAA